MHRIETRTGGWGVYGDLKLNLAKPFVDENISDNYVSSILTKETKHDPLAEATKESMTLWSTIRSELFSLQEDRFLIKKTLFPPYAPVDKKLRHKFNTSIGKKKTLSLEALQERLRLLTTSPELRARMEMLKLDIQLDEDIAYQKEERRRELEEKQAVEQELKVSQSKTTKKKAKTKKELALERKQRIEEQVAKDALEADKLYLVMCRMDKVAELERSVHSALNTLQLHTTTESLGHEAKRSVYSASLRHPSTQDEFIVMGSRSKLSRKSTYIHDQLKTQKTMELYHDGHATQLLVLHCDSELNQKQGAAHYGYNELSVVEHFVKYTQNDNVRANERRVQQELDHLVRTQHDSMGIEASLEKERESKVKMLKNMEAMHKARLLQILERQMEEDIRRIRLNHLRTVETEVSKLRTQFNDYADYVNQFFIGQLKACKTCVDRFHEQRVTKMRASLQDISAVRETVLPMRMVPKLLVLGTTLGADALVDDCRDILTQNIVSVSLDPDLYCPVLFSSSIARKLFADCTDDALLSLKSFYTWDEWHERILKIYSNTSDLRVRGIMQRFQKDRDVHMLINELQKLLLGLFVATAPATKPVANNRRASSSLAATSSPRQGDRRLSSFARPNNLKMDSKDKSVVAITAQTIAFANSFRFTELEKNQRDKAFQLKITRPEAFTLTDLYNVLQPGPNVRNITLDREQQRLVQQEITVREKRFQTLALEFNESPLVHSTKDHTGVRIMCTKSFRYVTLHTTFGLNRVFPVLSEQPLQRKDLPEADDENEVESEGPEFSEPQNTTNKWYFEVTIGSVTSEKTTLLVGWDIDNPNVKDQQRRKNCAPLTCDLPPNTQPVPDNDNFRQQAMPTGCVWQNDGLIYHNGDSYQMGVGYGPGDVIGCAFDQDTETYYFFKNGHALMCCNIQNDEWSRVLSLLDANPYEYSPPPSLVRKKETSSSFKTAPSSSLEQRVVQGEKHEVAESSIGKFIQSRALGAVQRNHSDFQMRLNHPELTTAQLAESVRSTVVGKPELADDLKSLTLRRPHAAGFDHGEGYNASGVPPAQVIGGLSSQAEISGMQYPAFVMPMHSVPLPLHSSIYPVTVNLATFDSLGEDVRIKFGCPTVVPARVTPLHDASQHRIFGHFRVLEEVRSSRQLKQQTVRRDLAAQRQDLQAATVFGSAEKTVEEAETRFAEQDDGDYTVRPCISLYASTYNPNTQLHVNFRGPFKNNVSGFQSLLHALSEEQEDESDSEVDMSE